MDETNGGIRATPWVILGCGYTGQRLARRLRDDGRRVVLSRRDLARATALAAPLGAEPVAVDLTEPGALAELIPAGAVVVDSVPPTAGDVGPERAVAAAAAAAGARRLIYLSSTGVYPPGGGSIVDETTLPAPAAARGSARLAAETALLAAAAERALDAVSLRIVGIYGPGRGVHTRLAAGTYRVVGDGSSLVCRVHVDDLVAAIIAVAEAAVVPSRVYNVADDTPTPSAEHGERVAAMLGLPSPPRVPADQVSAEVRAMLGADRRVDNSRLKRELGWAPRYADAVDGVAASIAEERSA